MIEMLGVLAIVGVLSAGGIAGYSMAMQNYKTTQLIDKMQLIATQVRAVYKGNYSDLSSFDNLISIGKIPDRNNPFGGYLGGKKLNDNVFFIVGSSIPPEACVDVLQTDWGDRGMFEGIAVYEGDTRLQYFNYTQNTYPVDMTTSISICKGSDKKLHLDFK